MRDYRGQGNKGWEYGYLVRVQFCGYDRENYPECNNSEYLEYSKDGISYGYKIYRDGQQSSVWVKSNSIGEYIEKDDRNGKNIYMGDIIEANIIKWHLPTMGVIVFDATLSSYGNKNEAGITLLHQLDSIKIIDNVTDNPELLRENKNE